MGCALPLPRAHPAHCHILKEQQTTPLTRTSCSLLPILDSTDAAGSGSSFFTLRPGVNDGSSLALLALWQEMREITC